VNQRTVAGAIGQPDVVDRMLEAIQARAVGEHPAREHAVQRFVRLDFIDFGKYVRLRRLGRGSREADARGNLQGAELGRLVDRDFERLDSSRDLVETGKDGGRMLDLVGRRGPRPCQSSSAAQAEGA